MKDQQVLMSSFDKILSWKREREFLADSKIVKSMLKNIGIDEFDKDVVDSLMEFNNYDFIALILEQAKERAANANKNKVCVNDIQRSIQVLKHVGFPGNNKLKIASPLLPNNPTSELENSLDGPHFSAKNDMNIIDNIASEIINLAEQKLVTKNTDIPTQNDQNLDNLPELTGMDIEEILKNPTGMDYEEPIENPQNNKEEIKHKVDGFNVEALLNDPYLI
ncbi:uncharacterized protein LOC126551857 [Aphis gossypii]|uniref:uncharacterized protein LOC126551857 n=1 Tax=Aphis gossypii TaxID=80765 RepID=UPI002158C7D0|nr:uncharacterized protein LOC126551857 [Aphis gossypii]XP_050062144.1 uncharacterized protein LOC126551857 [Aphis gossypii]